MVRWTARLHIDTRLAPGLARAHGRSKRARPHQCDVLVGSALCPPGGEHGFGVGEDSRHRYAERATQCL
nr:MAG TPA: hypothetical protein [Caudoviricetes sp.]